MIRGVLNHTIVHNNSSVRVLPDYYYIFPFFSIVGDVNKDTVEDYEAFVSKYSKILHPTHVLNIKIKSKLCTFYGKLAGYTMTDLSKNRNLVDKKLKYCKESLSSIEKIECGLSSLKGELQIYIPSISKFEFFLEYFSIMLVLLIYELKKYLFFRDFILRDLSCQFHIGPIKWETEKNIIGRRVYCT